MKFWIDAVPCQNHKSDALHRITKLLCELIFARLSAVKELIQVTGFDFGVIVKLIFIGFSQMIGLLLFNLIVFGIFLIERFDAFFF